MKDSKLPKTIQTHLELWCSQNIVDASTAQKMTEASHKYIQETSSHKTIYAGIL